MAQLMGARMHANRTRTIWEEEYGQYPVCGAKVERSAQRGWGERGTGDGTEASGCGRRAKVCLARFILRHAVAATSSSLSLSASLAMRRASNCWIVSSLQSIALGWTGEQSGDCLEAQGPCDHRCEAHRERSHSLMESGMCNPRV